MRALITVILIGLTGSLLSCSDGGGSDVDDGPGLPTPTGFTVNISSPTAAGTGSTVNLTFKTSDPTATFECTLDGLTFACTPFNNPTQFLTHGSHNFKVKGTQPSGGVATSEVTWNVDAQGPTVQIVVPNPTFTSATGSFNFATDDAVLFLCALDGGQSAICVNGSPFVFTPGPHTLEVQGFDKFNNPSPVTSVSFTIN